MMETVDNDTDNYTHLHKLQAQHWTTFLPKVWHSQDIYLDISYHATLHALRQHNDHRFRARSLESEKKHENGIEAKHTQRIKQTQSIMHRPTYHWKSLHTKHTATRNDAQHQRASRSFQSFKSQITTTIVNGCLLSGVGKWIMHGKDWRGSDVEMT